MERSRLVSWKGEVVVENHLVLVVSGVGEDGEQCLAVLGGLTGVNARSK